MFLRNVRCCPSSTPLLLATLTLFFYCCNPLFLRCSLSTCLLLVFVLLRDVVTTLLLKSLQWLPRLLDEDECYQLGVLLSGQSSLHCQTSFISVTPSFFPLTSLWTLPKWLLKWSSQDFNTCYSTSPLLSLYLAHPDSALKSQLNHRRSVSPITYFIVPYFSPS